MFPINRLHIQNQQLAGQVGQSSSTADWLTLNLNTVLLNTITDASLDSNIVTLPAGTYFISAYQCSYRARATQIALYNNTQSAFALFGRSVYGDNTDTDPPASLAGVLTITGAEAFVLQGWTTDAESGGYGQDVDATLAEVYADFLVEQLA